MKDINIGIQLYSVRDEIKEYGVDEVFKTLSECGCNTVEFAGFYGLTPAEMKEKLEKYSLRPLAAHIRASDVIASLSYIDELGIKMVCIPGYSIDLLSSEEGFKEFCDIVKEIKPELDRRGVRFGYHNHARELLGEDLLIKMAKSIEGFTIELDIYWAKAAGKEPAALIAEYGNALSALHIKDMDARADTKNPGEFPNAIIGEGQCNAEAAFNKAYENGVDTYILEVEYYPCPYAEYIKKSVDNINEFYKNVK